jgi:hypothetical protein
MYTASAVMSPIVLDAVEISVDAAADDLDRLHAQLVVTGAAIEVAEEGDAAFPLERPDDQRRRGRRVVDRRLEVDPTHTVGVERDPAGGRLGSGRTQRPVSDPLGPEVDGSRTAPCARLANEPRLVGREIVRHLLGQPLDGAGGEDVWGVAFDEQPDVSRAERVAVHVLGGRAGSIFEWLLVTLETALGVGAGDPVGLVREPLGRSFQVGARHAGEALPATDVGAAAVERVELGGKQLVAKLERLLVGGAGR